MGAATKEVLGKLIVIGTTYLAITVDRHFSLVGLGTMVKIPLAQKMAL